MSTWPLPRYLHTHCVEYNHNYIQVCIITCSYMYLYVSPQVITCLCLIQCFLIQYTAHSVCNGATILCDHVNTGSKCDPVCTGFQTYSS